jgi:hypothetical protein
MAHGLPAPLITPLANDYCAGAVTISNGLSLGQNLVPTTSPFNAGPIGLQMLGNVGYTNGVSLAPIGMPGCYLWSECVVINTLVASGIQATYTMAIPNNTALLGYQLKAQSAAMAPGYNAFGFITSNGWWMTLGN